jgi:hypothetical protein
VRNDSSLGISTCQETLSYFSFFLSLLTLQLKNSLTFSPSSLDAIVFGYLATQLLPPFKNRKLQDRIAQHNNLVRFCNHILENYFNQTPVEGTNSSFFVLSSFVDVVVVVVVVVVVILVVTL